MAQNRIVVTLGVSLPWWWRLYFEALKFYEYTIGGVDPERAAEFVVRHVRFYSVDGEGRRTTLPTTTVIDDKTRRYFERAPLGHHVCPSDLDLDQE